MTDHGSYEDLNQFQATRTTQRWWPNATMTCAVLGGIYGMAVGSAISTTAEAAGIIGIAAAIMAVLCGVPGARFGALLGMVIRTPFARLFLGVLAAMVGAIIGGFLGMAVVIPLGAILGAVGGWVFVGAILRGGGWLWRLQWQGLGVVLGACIGATILALNQAPSAALVGIAIGFGIGAVLGPLPLLLFVKMMGSLAVRQHAERKIVDVKVVDVPKDEIEGRRDDQS